MTLETSTGVLRDFFNAYNQGNYVLANKLLKSVSYADFENNGVSVSETLHSLGNLARTQLNDTYKADIVSMAVRLVEIGNVESALNYEFYNFAAIRYFEALTGMMKVMSQEEASAISSRTYKYALSQTANTPEIQGVLAKQIMDKVAPEGIMQLLGDLSYNNNFNLLTVLLKPLSLEKAAAIDSGVFNGLLTKSLEIKDLTTQTDFVKLVLAKTEMPGIDLSKFIVDFADNHNFDAMTAIIKEIGPDGAFLFAKDYQFVLKQVANFADVSAQASLAKLIVESGELDGKVISSSLTLFAENHNLAAVNSMLNAMSHSEKMKISDDVIKLLDDLGFKAGNNTITGSDERDVIFGFGGNDHLSGGGGNDVLHGGSGDDWLHGWTGKDVLTGGRGADMFAFSHTDAVDRITDFNIDEGDRLGFSATMFTVGTNVIDNMSAVDAAIQDFVFARTVGESTIVSIDADGKGAGLAIDVAVLEGVKDFDVAAMHARGQVDII